LSKQVEPAYGLETPLAVAALQMADRTVTVRVGAQDPTDKSYVVQASSSPYIVRALEYSVQDLVTYTRQDLLAKPPEPPAVATPSISR
ncbi:MAG: hypothetical protein V1772_06590, partial [Chloroflexota bacterium]